MLQEIYKQALFAVTSVRANASSWTVTREAASERWLRDPLSHPVLDAMSLSELADLPPTALRSCCRE